MISFYINKILLYLSKIFVMFNCQNSPNIFSMCRYLYCNRISVSSVPLRYAHLVALSRSLIAEMWGSGSSLGFFIDCTEKQVNPRRKWYAAVVTLFVPYYFYPVKFPALKICENRDGSRREVSIEV